VGLEKFEDIKKAFEGAFEICSGMEGVGRGRMEGAGGVRGYSTVAGRGMGGMGRMGGGGGADWTPGKRTFGTWTGKTTTTGWTGAEITGRINLQPSPAIAQVGRKLVGERNYLTKIPGRAMKVLAGVGMVLGGIS